jgi:hypothetical protein
VTPGPEWDGILREGEVILWQGKPDPGFYLHPSRKRAARVSVIIFAVALLMTLGIAAEGETLIVLFLSVFVAVGGFFVYDSVFRPIRERRHSFYTLTNTRAIIGLALPGRERSLKSFELFAEREFEYIPGRLGSIVFDREYTGTKINEKKQYYAVGFMRFEGAEEVWQKVQDLRKARHELSDHQRAAD